MFTKNLSHDGHMKAKMRIINKNKKSRNPLNIKVSAIWSRQGSNLRPPRCRRDALPAELQDLNSINQILA